MGRIKSALIKRTAKKLMQEQEFKDNFEENKRFLNETVSSKRIRNMIAGYITKLVKAQKQK